MNYRKDIKYNIIKEYKKNITESTLKIHILNINTIIKLIGNDNFNNYEYIKNKILNDVSTIYTKRNKLTSLIVYLRASDSDDILINKYSELIECLSNKIDKINFKKNKKEEDNWLSIEEIKNKVNELRNNTIINPITYKDLKQYMKFIIFYFHIYIESLRNDISCIIIDEYDINFNIFDSLNKQIIINKYKTEKTHGQITIKLNNEQFETIIKYIESLNFYKKVNNIHNNYFLIAHNGNMMTRNYYSKFFNTIYEDKNINVNMIRKIMASNNCDIIKIKEKAKRMGHSLTTHLNNYVKELQ
jgi:hypothetical protein